jgi:glycosyltransferase involved in cell wall biosynthesis
MLAGKPIRRILFVTDAWRPQVNGVVRTLGRMEQHLPKLGIEPLFLSPDGFRTVGLPTYPGIRLALPSPRAIRDRIETANPDHIHIVTEGPLGVLARRECLRRGRPFTTMYHTKFPEYLSARMPVPESFSYGLLRRFHNSGEATLVATQSLSQELVAKGFTKVRPWTRGVDTEHFNPGRRADIGILGPIFLYVGRIAVEKTIEDFLSLDLPGSKVLVGIGPALDDLKKRFPAAHFLGERSNGELAKIYASSDVFVFPSKTDTFGIVLLEAMASGLTVAAYPVTGPVDIFADGIGGALSADLHTAALVALEMDRGAARAKALTYSWDNCAAMFLERVREVYAPPVGRAA